MNNSFKFAFALTAIAGLTACDDNNGNMPENDGDVSTDAICLLYQGDLYNSIEGALDIIDCKTMQLISNVFKTQNGRNLGDTPQCGLTYGSRIYLGIHVSKTIQVIDRQTYKSVRQISLTDPQKGTQPRSMVAHGGKVYISMFDGYVARLDTASLEIDAAVKVGPNPEIIALHDGKLYVPNSDGMNFPNFGKTASVVSLNPFKTESTIDVPLNPAQFISGGSKLYLLSKGNYDDIPSAVYEIKADGKYEKIADATLFHINGDTMYLVNCEWEKTPEFTSYSITTKDTKNLKFDKVKSPANFSVDPVTGNFIFSTYAIEDNGKWNSSLRGDI